MTPALNLVVLRCTDLDWAQRFYECLGLQFTRHRHGSGPEHLSAELGGSVFELYPLSPNGASTLGTRIGFRVPSLESVITALSDYPAAIISPPQDSPWGRRAVVADPDGHRVELVQGVNSLRNP
jgi:lactoylglutathione lyase